MSFPKNISDVTANVLTTYADFIGNYAPLLPSPVGEGAGVRLLDAHNPDGDAMHGAISIHEPSVSGWFTDANLTTPVTTIPFASNGTVTLYAAHLSVDGYGTGTDKWMFIASPVEGRIAPTEVENLIGNPIPETNPVVYDYDLYRFNQSAAMEWENYHQHNNDFVLENGKGYLYARQNDVNLFFNGTLNTDNEMSVNLDYDGSARIKGYNLVGNPFPCEAYVNRPFYRMNAAGNDIEPVVNYDSYTPTTIPPYTGIIVKADGANESVTFSTSAPMTSTGNHGNLAITLSQTKVTRDGSSTATHDKAIVSFNEGAQLGKFVFNRDHAKLYIPQGHEDYAIVSVDRDAMHCVSTEIPINFKAKENGEYTITVNPEGVEMSYLHLIDNITGTDIDLLQTPSYTFEGKTDDYASRFKLVFSANGDAEDDDEAPFAFINNGNIIITDADAYDASLQVIDMMGRIIVCRDATHCVSTTGLTPGVYVLRLIDGEMFRTQKIVIK